MPRRNPNVVPRGLDLANRILLSGGAASLVGSLLTEGPLDPDAVVAPEPLRSVMVGGKLLFEGRGCAGQRAADELEDALRRRRPDDPLRLLPERAIRPPIEGEPPPKPFSLFRIPPVGDTPSPAPGPPERPVR